jgi:hypothetical protein
MSTTTPRAAKAAVAAMLTLPLFACGESTPDAASAGSLYFLKGDKMLEATYLTSSTDVTGVTRLAAAAIARL